MTRTSTTRLAGMLAVLAFSAMACGGSAEDDFRDQIKAVDSSVTDEMVDCIIEELDARGLTVEDISDEAIGDGPVPAGGQEAFTTCILGQGGAGATDDGASDSSEPDSGSSGSGSDDSSGTDSSGTGSTGVIDTYGDDPELDGLWDACDNGDGAACDDLFFQSPLGSDYEDFGNTCGRRFETSPGFCEDEI